MTSWDEVLSHRPPETRPPVQARFATAGVTPAQVQAALLDGGDDLWAAAVSGKEDWAEVWGGALPAALLAAEVGALTAHLTSRSSAIRALAVEALLDDYSAVAVAGRLGVSRQKVYEIGRPHPSPTFISTAPWRQP